MALHGYARLDICDAKTGHILKRVEKHNTITPFVADAITKGDFNGIMDRNKILPIAQNWFGGCILTDIPNPNSDQGGGFFGMIAGDANVVAMAGNDSYSGTNHKRGSADFTTGATGEIENGYRLVWRWSENQGNGHIESVCLTRPNLGKVHYLEAGNFDYEDDQTLPKTYMNDQLSNGTAQITDDINGLTVIDYDNEIGYKVWYEGDSTDGDIKIEEYALNTWRQHITGASCAARHKIGSTHIIHVSGGVKNYGTDSATVCYTGNKLHLITFAYSSGSETVNDYVIDPSDYTALDVVYSRQYSGVEFLDIGVRATTPSIVKDGLWVEIESNTPYLYALAEVSSKTMIVRCNLTSSADVSEVVECPISMSYQPIWIGLPNNDRIAASRVLNNTSAFYWHNNKWYKTNVLSHSVQGCLLQGIHGGDTFGTNLLKMHNIYAQDQYKNVSLDAFFGWVSTVANLSTSVDKNITQTMNLIYEITESSN